MRFVNRNNVCEVALALFLLPIAGTKEKAKQKENAVEGSFAACGRRPKALPSEKARLYKGLNQTLKRAKGDSSPHHFAHIVSG